MIRPMALAVALFLGLLISSADSLAQDQLSYAPPDKTAAQKQVKQLLQQGDFSAALEQWSVAYSNSAFARSTTGYALYYYVLFKNGLETTAVEKLSNLRRPQKINRKLKNDWAQLAPNTHPVWKVATINNKTGLYKVIPGLKNSSAFANPIYSLTNQGKVNKFKKSHSRRKNIDQEQWIQNQVALWEAINSYTTNSLKRFKEIEKKPGQFIEPSRLYINYARVLFQKRKFEKALQYYNKVSKGSDHWIEAVEERAWTYVRLKQPEKALAEIRTLMAPMFNGQIGPEPFFLQAYTNLRICDYNSVFKNIDTFKKRYRNRLINTQKLAKTGGTAEAHQAIEALIKGPYQLKTIAKWIPTLPRMFHRDEYIRRNIEKRRALQMESSRATALGDNINEKLVNTIKQRADNARDAIFKRLKFLADLDLAEIRNNLTKMHIIEAEVIQRIHTISKENNQNRSIRGATPVKSNDVLVFPVTQEVWVDELDNYQIQIKDCPSFGSKQPDGRKLGGKKL